MWQLSEWWLRCLDAETYIGSIQVPFLRTGFRMVVFSIVIMIVVLFFRRGLMGDKELADLAGSAGARLGKAEEGGGEMSEQCPESWRTSPCSSAAWWR